MRFALFLFFGLLIAFPAEARHPHQASQEAPQCFIFCLTPQAYPQPETHQRPSYGVVGGRPEGCPHAYCGCAVSLRVFGRIVDGLNLAANWSRFRPADPAPGRVAYRAHHVFLIQEVNADGTVVAYNPNSGSGLTRITTVSLRGYRVVDPSNSTRL